MDAGPAQQWIQALRSDHYKQGRGQLRKGNTFCALGVLCDVVKPQGWAKNGFGVWAHDGQGTALSRDFAVELGMRVAQDGTRMVHPGVDGVSFAHMNDRQAKSFADIADLIEANWETI